MGLPLPAELAGLAIAVGLTWPEADEDALHAAALRWAELAAALRSRSADAATEVARLLAEHPDGGLAGFAAGWRAGPRRGFADAALAAEVLAGCLTTLAAVVLELKVFAVGRLAELAARLAVPVGDLADQFADQAAATALTRAALRQARAGATAVVDGALVPVLRAAEHRLRAGRG